MRMYSNGKISLSNEKNFCRKKIHLIYSEMISMEDI